MISLRDIARRAGRSVPGPTGVDHIKAVAGFVRSPYDTLPALHAQHGPVFEMGFAHFKITYLLGPEGNKLVMVDRADNFRFREAYEVLIPITGETALIVSDGDASKRRRRLVQPAFHRQRVNGYLGFINSCLEDTLRTYVPGQTVDIYRSMRATIRRIVIRSLFGENLSKRSDELGDLIQEMLDFVNKVLVPQVKVDVPFLPYGKFLAAKRELDARIYREIARRRAAPDEGDDVMALLLATKDESGDSLSDVEVRDQVVSLITAGYETTSSAVGWGIYAMLSQPEIWQRAKEEAQRVVGDGPVQIEHLERLEYIDRVVSETLRLFPSVFIGVRKVVGEFEAMGHKIPGGGLVAYSPYVTHRMTSIWPDPERFDPDRWDASRPGYKAPTPYEYVPFGGGARRCIGQSFALLDMKAMFATIVRRAELTLLPQDIVKTGFSAMYPKEGIAVRVGSVKAP